uniref:DUF4283 domain-containing protein n=1 Tax=Quercus lobata TaxID=97700 RepID=A0A7N2LCH9_QUELO
MNNTPQETENPVITYLRGNSRKKSYAEATLDAVMHKTKLEDAETKVDEEVESESERTGRTGKSEEQPREEDQMNNEEEWEIHVSADLKRKMSGPWQNSIILKLMGKQLVYRALQTRLAGIWHPTGNTHLIDIGYRYFIMKFDALKDYHHALMDGPWFVGEQYLHVQAWEANFHPSTAKVTTTVVWIRLEQLPIEYGYCY